MKRIALALLFISGFCIVSQADIVFENKVSSDPISISLTKMITSPDEKTLYFQDIPERTRLILDFSYLDFAIHNSQGKLITRTTTNGSGLAVVARKLLNISESCPAVVKIDRNSLTIIEIISCGKDIETLELVTVDDCGDGICYLKNKHGVHAFSFGRSSRWYQVNPPGLVPVAWHRYSNLNDLDVSKISSYVRNVSPSCPLKVTYNTATLEVKKMNLECDPLAVAPDQIPRG